MDLRTILSKRIDKKFIQFCVNEISKDTILYNKLIDLFFNGETKSKENAAWILSHCHDKHPHLIAPFLKKLIKNLKTNQNVAVKRNTLRILQTIDIPENIRGDVTDFCFNALTSSGPVAIKAFALTILENICLKEKELLKELLIIIEDQLPFETRAYKSRANKILKKV